MLLRYYDINAFYVLHNGKTLKYHRIAPHGIEVVLDLMALSRLTINDKLYELAEQCSQCGKCTSSCPAARFLMFRPRKIALAAQKERIDEIIDNEVIWWCAQCHVCIDRCPREVTPFDIVIYLQNLAVMRGKHFPKDLETLLNGVKRQGVYQLPREIMDKEFEDYDRESLNLPPYTGPKDMDAFRRGLAKIMEEKQ